nr:maleylpyruvate isomerase family mycothiol-dependent enzyme [Mycobacterium tuberculosis]
MDRSSGADGGHRRGRVRRADDRRRGQSGRFRRRRRDRTGGRFTCRTAHRLAGHSGRLHEELLAVPDGRKLAWFGPPMSAASMATARLMETWAHGLDVADALGVIRPATQRLRSIAHLGVRTRDYAFIVNNLTPPAEPFLVELRGPSGDTWSWGPSDAAQRVTGSAEDFCFLVTQRRALSTLDVNAVGEDAQRWLTIAQAFAGPPGRGR